MCGCVCVYARAFNIPQLARDEDADLRKTSRNKRPAQDTEVTSVIQRTRSAIVQ